MLKDKTQKLRQECDTFYPWQALQLNWKSEACMKFTEYS